VLVKFSKRSFCVENFLWNKLLIANAFGMVSTKNHKTHELKTIRIYKQCTTFSNWWWNAWLDAKNCVLKIKVFFYFHFVSKIVFLVFASTRFEKTWTLCYALFKHALFRDSWCSKQTFLLLTLSFNCFLSQLLLFFNYHRFLMPSAFPLFLKEKDPFRWFKFWKFQSPRQN
jgi:hypothetical protein